MAPEQRLVTISVVVCTHNRSRHLRPLVTELAPLLVSGEVEEVILVDNASMDGTGLVIDELAAAFDGIRGVHEPVLGLSRARNLGYQVARGDVVAFLDDDARPRPGWAAALRVAFTRAPVAAVGGRIEPGWPGGRMPSWLSEPLLPYWSCTNWGDAPRRLEATEVPIGANMAFRRSVLVELGGFSPMLGRIGRTDLAGEENDLFARLQAQALGEVWYVPEAVVDHLIEPERMTLRFLLRRAYWLGRTEHERRRASGNEVPLRTRVASESAQFVRRPKEQLRAVLSQGLLPGAVYAATRALTIGGYIAAGRASPAEDDANATSSSSSP